MERFKGRTSIFDDVCSRHSTITCVEVKEQNSLTGTTENSALIKLH
jgi:hypothetical protein